MKNKNCTLVSIGLAAILILTGCNISLAGDITPPPGYQPPVYKEPELLTGATLESIPNPANGAAIYAEKCEACHGIGGLGDGPDSTALPNEVARIGAPDVANLSSPLGWYSVVLQGNIDRFMPPFSGSLSSEDVWDVLAYTYTFSADQEMINTGSQVFADTCASCHGPGETGGGMPGAADLLDAERMVLLSVDDVIQKIATGSGNDDHVFGTELDARQIEAAALYVRSLIFPLEGEAVFQEPTPAVPADTEDTETVEEPSDEKPADSTGEEAAPTEGVETDDGLGMISGEVVNGSGGDIPEDLEVRLEVYESFELVYEETTPVEEDGSYTFEDISIEPELIYITLIELDGIFFPSAFHIGDQTTGETIDLPITVYDATSDTSDLAISRLHVFFEFTDVGTVQVIHQATISNRGNKMVAPESETEPVLNFSLPAEATALIFQNGTMGNPYLQTNSGFADPTPVMPGEDTYEVLFAYEIPFSNNLDWQLPVDLPTDIAVMFVSGNNYDAESELLESSGTETLGEDLFQVFVADSLDTSQMYDMKISKPLFGGSALQDNWLMIVLGVAGLALAVYGAWSFLGPIPEEDLVDDDQDSLIEEIIALDEAYEAGDLAESDYRARRDTLKRKLQELVDGGND